jgi:hypothetical protein
MTEVKGKIHVNVFKHITWKDKLSRSSQLGVIYIFSINLSLNRLYLMLR